MAKVPSNLPSGFSTSPKGKVTSKIHGREEEYALVTRPDLEEIADFGRFEHLLTGVGTFFAGGAFWQGVSIIVEQQKFALTPWLGVDLLAMFVGGLLFFVGHGMYRIKQRKIKKYFPSP
jgi:hypothetical protein